MIMACCDDKPSSEIDGSKRGDVEQVMNGQAWLGTKPRQPLFLPCIIHRHRPRRRSALRSATSQQYSPRPQPLLMRPATLSPLLHLDYAPASPSPSMSDPSPSPRDA